MWPYPTIIAHRGGGTLAPENTLAALRCGWSHGFRGVEFDVMLTRDQEPILMHDPVLGRTLPGSGKVADHTLSELLALDAGGWHSLAFAGEPVCTLAQAMAFCRQHAIWMNIEIKPAAEEVAVATGTITAQAVKTAFADVLAARVAGANDASLPLFSSFSFAALMAAKAAAPEIPRGFLVDEIPDDWLQRLQMLDAVALHTNQKNISEKQVRVIKDAGFGLFCYTVNDPERAREIRHWGVDGFCTDRIDLIGPD